MLSTVITDLFHAIDARDWNAFGRIFHPEIVYDRPGYESFSGLERLLKFYRDERILASGSHYIEQIVIENNHGACWGRFIGLKKDGTPADVLFTDVYSFEQGRIKKRRSYFFRPAV